MAELTGSEIIARCLKKEGIEDIFYIMGGPMLLAPPELDPLTELPPAQIKAGSIEIALPNGARISVDASVNEKALSRVLRA